MSVDALDRKHALIAPGQGSQSIGMGSELAKASPAAAKVWADADKALLPDLGFTLSGFVWQGTIKGIPLHKDSTQARALATERINKTENAQPARIVTSLASRAALEEAGLLGAPYWHAGNSLGFI